MLDVPHRRYNPLTGDFVLVSPQRVARPWKGQVETSPAAIMPRYDPNCYLCPGNERTSGSVNPQYLGTYVFTNDFPALLDVETAAGLEDSDLFRTDPVKGTCRVLCFSPRHDLTLPLMSVQELSDVVEVWCGQLEDLGKTYSWVQIFQNQGEMMGASNPHPHCQIWAIDGLPNEPQKEDVHQRSYYTSNQIPLLCDYIDEEAELDARVVILGEHWTVLVPYWAVWPFETLILPNRHVLRMTDLLGEERRELAEVLIQLTTKYDNLFEAPFPYSMGWHGAPFVDGDVSHWQLHGHFYPPLLRSATIKKFMVGYEMLAEAQRDLTAEDAAQRLIDSPSVHYSKTP
jgi:UDPglucose--hexose-1-phosphate uridylyltransferase